MPVQVLTQKNSKRRCWGSQSYSKNLGLYAERVGAFTYLGVDADTTKKVPSYPKPLSSSPFAPPPLFPPSSYHHSVAHAYCWGWEHERSASGVHHVMYSNMSASSHAVMHAHPRHVAKSAGYTVPVCRIVLSVSVWCHRNEQAWVYRCLVSASGLHVPSTGDWNHTTFRFTKPHAASAPGRSRYQSCCNSCCML